MPRRVPNWGGIAPGENKLFGLRISRALVLATIVSMLMASSAFADTVYNDLDTTIDATAETASVEVGAIRTVTLKVDPAIGDGKNGCNLTGSTTLVTSVASSAPAKASASPSSITWTSCGQATLVTVTGVAVGSATISLAQTSNSTGGTFDLAPATFNVNVTAAPPTDTTGPSITPSIVGTLGTNGWYTSDVTLSWAVSDAESAVSSSTGCGTTNITSDQASTDYTCSATSGGGSNSQTVSIKRDATAPSATLAVFAGAAGSNGWYTSDVTVRTSGTDDASGIASCTADQPQTGETTGTTFNGSCTDNAGLVTNASSLTVKLDKSAPVITPTVSGTAGTPPWYTSNVDVTWTVTDSISGIGTSAAACGTTTSITADSLTGTTVTCNATNGAGLSASESVGIFKDASAPVLSKSVSGTLGNDGWYTGDVTVDWAAPSDPHSGIASSSCADVTINADTAGTASTCTATNGAGLVSSDSVTVKRDATKPTITGAVAPAAPNGTNSWYKTAPTVTFTCSDATSDIESCLADGEAGASSTLDESSTAQTVSGTATDKAGNAQTASVSGLKVDLSDPTNLAFVGGPAAGGSYIFGSVPAAPTCSADDAISGLASCVVSGYGTTVGTHTMTATATDNAGRTATAQRTYTVLAWTLNGFFSPVDMAGVVNTVKGGSTVPLKFEIFAGATELTTTSSVESFKVVKTVCDAGASMDDIELTTTGGTSLRYDTTGSQFIQNWQTPKAAGTCYRVTMTAQDGSAIIALFKLK